MLFPACFRHQVEIHGYTIWYLQLLVILKSPSVMYTSDMKILSGLLNHLHICFNFSLFLYSFCNIFFDFFPSNSGHPFASGFTLSKLAAVTVDEDGNETFDAGVALDKLRKVRTYSCFVTINLWCQKHHFFFGYCLLTGFDIEIHVCPLAT